VGGVADALRAVTADPVLAFLDPDLDEFADREAAGHKKSSAGSFHLPPAW
jgi:hypothetical protein